LEIILAEPVGYCYGVERALNIAQKALQSENTNIYTLGPIIHNPQVVKELKKEGIKIIESLEGVDIGTIIIRAHGIDPKKIRKAKEIGHKIIDATCPFVKINQNRASQLIKGDRLFYKIFRFFAFLILKILFIVKFVESI